MGLFSSETEEEKQFKNLIKAIRGSNIDVGVKNSLITYYHHSISFTSFGFLFIFISSTTPFLIVITLSAASAIDEL